MNDDYPANLAYPGQDYADETEKLLVRMQGVSTQNQYNEIKFFDGKINIANGMIGTAFFQHACPIEQVLWHTMGETSSVYDSGLSVWREKLRNSRIRPPTVVEHIYGDNMVTIDGGK